MPDVGQVLCRFQADKELLTAEQSVKWKTNREWAIQQRQSMTKKEAARQARTTVGIEPCVWGQSHR
jgi:hypothetical protein